jgi:putative ABC transport system permease protein
VQGIAAQPGVQAAAVATSVPFTADPAPHAFSVAGRPRPADLPVANHAMVGPDYFRVMGIPLLRGRAFDGRDSAGAPGVVIVSQSLARQFFPGADPLGQRLDLGRGGSHEIVGVAGDVKGSKLERGRSLQTYEPFAQTPMWDFTVLVRGKTAALPAAIAQVIRRLDPEQPVAVRPLDELVGDSLARQRFAMTLFLVFSAAALLLAGIGLYGVVAYTVGQRTAEIGIRRALGAQTGHVVRLVLGQGGRLIGLGLLAGLIGTLAVTRFLTPQLFGVGARDPLTLAFTALVLAGIAAMACWLPARRAARIDPMVALRTE